MVRYKVICLCLALVIGMTVCLPTSQAMQGDLVRLLKAFGIAYVVRLFADDMNSFVNRLADQRGIEWEGTTKVVPIISVGNGAYVGAAQVIGPSDRVDDVRAVGQGEARISDARAKLLFPINTTNPLKSLRRIEGVGVSAILDFRV